MKILYIGDVMGEPGVEVVERVLPDLVSQRQIDLVVAQAENVTNGKGLSVSDYERLKRAGVHAFSGGNWSLHLDETETLLNDPASPVVRPANYPEGTPGKEFKYIESSKGKVLLVSLLGSIVGKDADRYVDNPLQVIDNILSSQISVEKAAIVVNLHGDFSSEKRVIGYYLDGRATMVVGDHWHVPTADAMVLPHGTAHITDVGMCGTLHSSLGVKFDSVVPRWRDNLQTRNELETEGPRQFNAVLVETGIDSFKASSIEQIQKVF